MTIRAVIYSPSCKSHITLYIMLRSIQKCFKGLPVDSRETTLLLDSLFMTLLRTYCFDFSFIGYIGVNTETTVMLNHLSPRSIYAFYSFVITASFVSSFKSNPWSSSVSSIKHNIVEPITKDSWQNSAMKTSCQSIIAHTSNFVLSIDTKWVVSIFFFFIENLQWNKHSWLQFVK